ncbi:MAG: ABC transporter permease, partial [Proteobacteria bacterium]|nr:ABC transporter permease [Pseudomonadota bacterium]
MKKSTFVLIFSMVLWSVVLIFSSWDQSVLNTIDLEKILMPPSSESLFGSDDLGRSIGPRIVSGARLSLFVVIIVLTITSVFGTL